MRLQHTIYVFPLPGRVESLVEAMLKNGYHTEVDGNEISLVTEIEDDFPLLAKNMVRKKLIVSYRMEVLLG